MLHACRVTQTPSHMRRTARESLRWRVAARYTARPPTLNPATKVNSHLDSYHENQWTLNQYREKAREIEEWHGTGGGWWQWAKPRDCQLFISTARKPRQLKSGIIQAAGGGGIPKPAGGPFGGERLASASGSPLYAYIESVRSPTLEPAFLTLTLQAGFLPRALEPGFLPQVCVPLRLKSEKRNENTTVRPKPSEPCVPSPPPRSTPASSRCVLKLEIFTQPHTTSHTRTLPFCHSLPALRLHRVSLSHSPRNLVFVGIGDEGLAWGFRTLRPRRAPLYPLSGE